MAATTYDPQQAYAKFLKKKCQEEGHEHSEEHNNDYNDDKNCPCCPPGLVAVKTDDGQLVGCLTPNDAELYNASNKSCTDGYVALYKTGTPNVYLGCVSEENFAALYAQVNP